MRAPRAIAGGLAAVAVVAAALTLGGCGAGSTTFIHPQYDFGYIERVAVVPFENLSSDQGAGARVTRYFVTELLATRSFDVVEPGEVERALSKQGLVRTAELTKDQIKALGQDLGVQGLFLGSVGESAETREGGQTVSHVSLTARLVETDTGATIWSASNSAGGRGFWSSLFGTGGKSRSEVTRQCVRECIGTLVN